MTRAPLLRLMGAADVLIGLALVLVTSGAVRLVGDAFIVVGLVSILAATILARRTTPTSAA